MKFFKSFFLFLLCFLVFSCVTESGIYSANVSEDVQLYFLRPTQVTVKDSVLELIDFDLTVYTKNYELTKNNLSFIKDSIKNILLNLNEIDNIIEKNLQKYTISRFNYVDRAIIRLATYELINKLAPSQVVINEALELTKEYSNLDDDLQVKFNNKVLDNINKGLNNE